MNARSNTYDEVPYASHPYAQSHPDRLAVVATLFGINPASVSKCRVLELGCAGGGNLIPLASAYPDSYFLGIDASGRQVASGQQRLDQLQLTNIELRHQNILDTGADLGEFDYVICHGVYSWVPRNVKDRILEICARHLSPQGVGYISYNTYPGWHLRGTARDIMEFHARKFRTPADRVKHARALLDFLVKSVPANGDPYGLLLKGELELLRDKADSYVLHEHLEEVNEPVYFYQFDEHARSKGLRYLGEADFGAMSLRGFSDHVARTLRLLTDSFEEMEQYLDFMRNRMFRQTLVCHQEIELQRRIAADRLESLHVSAQVRLENSPADVPTRFATTGGTISTNDPLFKVALICLSEAWPAAIHFGQLANDVYGRLNGETVRETSELSAARQHLAACLVDGYAQRFIQFHNGAPPYGLAPGQCPAVSSFARLQAREGKYVTNLRHQRIELNDLSRRVAAMLDGARDRGNLVEALYAFVDNGTLSVQQNGKPCVDPCHIRARLAESLEKCLLELSRDALLLK